MWYPFFALAAQSPGRQRALRHAAVAHVLVLAGGGWSLLNHSAATVLGHVLLVAGIVEGAVLVGWRLAQLPKSRALEFLLVSPLPPCNVYLAEALVGLGRLALVTLSGVPVLVLLVTTGCLDPLDLAPLLVMPFTWGAVAGLGLAAWAYEPAAVRRWGERTMLAAVMFYLALGVIAGEHLRQWVAWLPEGLGRWFLNGFEAFHRYNPFAVLEFWLQEDHAVAGDRMLGLEYAALGFLGLLLARAATRLKGHFHDRHYKPLADTSAQSRGQVGDWPLSWWAVRRVTEYSGRVNLWLAAGFGSAYALYTVAEPCWPSWLGRKAFDIFAQMGGIPTLATALVVLAAVPAAFQYGLWDSNIPDRCRRLELLLLTRLGARDYWEAAAAAAWRRGRGYFAVALLLWSAAAVAGQIGLVQLLGALAAAIVLWGLYFTVGFRAFSRGLQANRLGLLLTVGLPLLTYLFYRAGWPILTSVLPPGSVYSPLAGVNCWNWLLGPVAGGLTALLLARFALARCDAELRLWYEHHHGRRVMD
jgi:hypothetical protein